MAYDTEFWSKLAQEAGASPEKVQALQQALEDDKVLKAISDRALARDDYSRNMDTLRKEKEGYNTWYQQALTTFESNKKAAEDYAARVKAYQDTYGDLDPAAGRPAPVTPTGDWIDRKAFEAELSRREAGYLGVMTGMVKFATDYQNKFGSSLDPDELVRYATEKGLPLNAAYDAYIAPRMLEKQSKDFEERLTQARAEGAKEALAKHRIPVDPRPSEPHFIFDRPAKEEGAPPSTAHERSRAFADFYSSPEMQDALLK